MPDFGRAYGVLIIGCKVRVVTGPQDRPSINTRGLEASQKKQVEVEQRRSESDTELFQDLSTLCLTVKTHNHIEPMYISQLLCGLPSWALSVVSKIASTVIGYARPLVT